MMDPGSTGPVHWGLLSIDRSQSTHMWAGTNYGGATPGDCNTYKSQISPASFVACRCESLT